MRKTETFKRNCQTNMLVKMFMFSTAFVFVLGTQGLFAQTSNTLNAGGGGSDAVVTAYSKQATIALMNTDLTDQQEATQLIRDMTEDLVDANEYAQQNPGTMTPAEFATNSVIIAYYSYLYNLLISGGDLYTVMNNSFGYLSSLVAQQNPAHGIEAMAIFQATLDLIAAD